MGAQVLESYHSHKVEVGHKRLLSAGYQEGRGPGHEETDLVRFARPVLDDVRAGLARGSRLQQKVFGWGSGPNEIVEQGHWAAQRHSALHLFVNSAMLM